MDIPQRKWFFVEISLARVTHWRTHPRSLKFHQILECSSSGIEYPCQTLGNCWGVSVARCPVVVCSYFNFRSWINLIIIFNRCQWVHGHNLPIGNCSSGIGGKPQPNLDHNLWKIHPENNSGKQHENRNVHSNGDRQKRHVEPHGKSQCSSPQVLKTPWHPIFLWPIVIREVAHANIVRAPWLRNIKSAYFSSSANYVTENESVHWIHESNLAYWNSTERSSWFLVWLISLATFSNVLFSIFFTHALWRAWRCSRSPSSLGQQA